MKLLTKNKKHVSSSKKINNNYIKSTEESDKSEYDLDQVDQEYTSKDTSINKGKLPAIYNLVSFPEGAVVLDYGGGKFDNGVEYLDSIGCEGYVYDPYNRTSQHNRAVVKTIREAGGADISLCSNVLNVIKEPEARLNVLKNIRKLTAPSGKVYITVYEGKGTGEGARSKVDAYQLNKKTKDYLEEIQLVFPDAKRKGKLIYATPSGKVTAATNMSNMAVAISATDSNIWEENIMRKLVKQLYNVASKVMQSADFGFPANEVDDYLTVEAENSLDAVRIEVRAEVSYDGLGRLADALNPIIQKMDPDAYFDMVEPGIMEAYVEIK